MSNSDRPSFPDPHITPAQGYLRPGLIYLDDSAVARQTMRRALYPHGLILETFDSLASFRQRSAFPVIGFLLDVDLADGVTGLEVARTLREEYPGRPIAFITAAHTSEREQTLAEFGPVFRKDGGTERAVQWLLDAVRAHTPSARSCESR